MVADPFTALGLAANIIQFIDFTCKLVAESRTIYQSANGASADSAVLKTIATDLSDLSAKLSSTQGSSVAGAELGNLADECKSVADELHSALQRLQVKGHDRIWKSFVVALREVLQKDRIEGISKRLGALQRQLNTRLLSVIPDGQSAIRQELQAIDDENKRLEMDRVKHLHDLKQELLDAILRLEPKSQLQTVNVADYHNSLRRSRPVPPRDIEDLSEKMRDLSNAVSKLAVEGKTVASEQMLLKSLCFKTMKVRHADIPVAHTHTFSWVFTEDTENASKPVGFLEWLKFRSGIFWVRGKAGSGKSTLMKFICGHEQTNEALRSWAARKKLVTANFFFWNAGTTLQKSQEGLLRSLLFEVLRQCPELIPRVCSRWFQDRPYHGEPDSWTRPELLDAFGLLMKQTTVSAKFCFFVDGLDEYDVKHEGDHNDLVNILKGLATSADIKMCLSSRPWYVFRDAFGQNNDRFLKLENLTRGDIKRYAQDTLQENTRFKQLRAGDERYPELVDQIVNIAEGVFLWVFLVVRSLLQGLTNADRVSDLQRRLILLPPTLEAYFQHMLNSIEDVYQEETAQAFQLSIQAAEPLSLMTFSFLDEEDPDFGVHAKIKPLLPEEIQSRQEAMRRRLDGRCKGLLEVKPRGGMREWGPFFENNVDFLHRTVRDFLLTRDMQIMLNKRLKNEFDPKILLCKAFLAQLKSFSSPNSKVFKNYGPLDDLLENLMCYAAQIEAESENLPDALYALLVEAEKVIRNPSLNWRLRRKENAFTGHAVERNLRLFTIRKLTECPRLLHTRARPLLDYALLPSQSKYETSLCFYPEMVALLLELGAMPNRKYKDSTLWARFMLSVHKGQVGQDHAAIVKITEMLLVNGAHLDQDVLTRTEFRSRKGNTGRGGDLYRTAGEVEFYITASQIISDKFSPEETKYLVSKAQKRSTFRLGGIWSWIGDKVLAA